MNKGSSSIRTDPDGLRTEGSQFLGPMLEDLFSPLCALCTLMYLVLQASEAFAGCEPQKTFQSYRFPIVLQVPHELQGGSAQRVIAWRYKQKSWSRIAIQTDERNSDNNYVLEDGIPYTKYTDDGILDSNDEISIRGVDAGESFDDREVSQTIRAMIDRPTRLDLCRGRVYVGTILVGLLKQTQSDTFLVAPRAVLRQSPAKEILATRYRYQFNQLQPMLMGQVFLRQENMEFQVFQSSNFIMPIIPSYWFLPTLKFDESDFTSEIECWRSGPVRSIVAVGAKLSKFFSIVKLHLFSELIFYEDYFQIPTKIEMVFNASDFLDSGSGLLYFLEYAKGREWTVQTNVPELPESRLQVIAKGGEVVTTALAAVGAGAFVVKGSRPEGSFMAKVHVDPKAMAKVPPPFMVYPQHYADSARMKSWSWLKSKPSDLGIFLDISKVHKGIYDFSLDLMLSSKSQDKFEDFESILPDWRKIQ